MPVARGWREVVFAICCSVKMSELRAVWTASDMRQEEFLKQILHSTQCTSLAHFHFLHFFPLVVVVVALHATEYREAHQHQIIKFTGDH